jgi:hypothetical protein
VIDSDRSPTASDTSADHQRCAVEDIHEATLQVLTA